MERKRFSVRQIPGLVIAAIMGIPIIEGDELIAEKSQPDSHLNGKNGNGATHDTVYTKTITGRDARRAMRRAHRSGK